MLQIPPIVDVTALTTAKRFLGGREICVIFLYEARKYIPAIQIILCCEANSMCCRFVKAKGRT